MQGNNSSTQQLSPISQNHLFLTWDETVKGVISPGVGIITDFAFGGLKIAKIPQ